MSVNTFKTFTSATQFVDFCKKLDIQSSLSDLDLETLYSYADENGYSIALVDNYSRYAERFSLSFLLFTFFDLDNLKDLALEVHLPEDLVDETDDVDRLAYLITTQIKDVISLDDFTSILNSFLPGDKNAISIYSEDYDDDYDFLVINDSIFI